MLKKKNFTYSQIIKASFNNSILYNNSRLKFFSTLTNYNTSFYDNKNIKQKKYISPWFITGFSDAEACFTCSIVKNKTSRFGYSLNLAFQIESHVRDLDLLQSIQDYFNTGSIIKISNRDVYQYRVKNKNGLQIIICHFYKYPLLTSKRIDFYLFSIIYNLLSKKIETIEDFLYCLAIINNINNPIKPEKLNILIENLKTLKKINVESNNKFKLPILILPPIKIYDDTLIIPNPY